METSLSTNNRAILREYAQNQWGALNLAQQKPELSFSQQISHAWLEFKAKLGLPSSQELGRGIGLAMAQAHGIPVSSEVINFLCRTVLGPTVQDQRTLGPQPSLEELARFTLTPVVLPLLETLGVATGSITLPAVIGLVSYVAQSLLGSRNGAEMLARLPDASSLIHYDGQAQEYRDIAGNRLSERDVKDIREVIYRYDIACRLLSGNRELIQEIFAEYTAQNADGTVTYLDGAPLDADAKDYERLLKAVERLEGVNPTKRFKGINRVINAFARHVPSVEPKAASGEAREIFVEDGMPFVLLGE